jgi:hypothetical protein
MKPKNTVIIILSLFLFSCEQKYSIRDNQVYLKGWNKGSGNYERLVEKADAKTFQKIENDENLTIGKDNKYVFFETEIIDNFDPKTLKYIGNYYFVDKDSAYFFGFYSSKNDCEIIGVNPNKLRIFKTYPWASDDKHIIYGHDIAEIKNINDFKVISENWGRTKTEILYKGKILNAVDINSFEIINDDKAKDKYHTYEYGEISN